LKILEVIVIYDFFYVIFSLKYYEFLSHKQRHNWFI